MYQLRIHAKQPEDTAPGNFLYSIDEILPDGSIMTLVGGGDNDLERAAKSGCLALHRYLSKPEGSVRYEFDCGCGSLLVIEARRSRKNPYTWDSPAQLTCSCGGVHGVKLHFYPGTGVPRLEVIPIRDPRAVSETPVPVHADKERIEFRLDFTLIVNTVNKHWPKKFITGSEILVLAGSPTDWVVNEIVPGPGEDPGDRAGPARRPFV